LASQELGRRLEDHETRLRVEQAKAQERIGELQKLVSRERGQALKLRESHPGSGLFREYEESIGSLKASLVEEKRYAQQLEQKVARQREALARLTAGAMAAGPTLTESERVDELVWEEFKHAQRMTRDELLNVVEKVLLENQRVKDSLQALSVEVNQMMRRGQ
jgi:hypothetical protein